jgi:quercetin dioxygenase-like cupin family protein
MRTCIVLSLLGSLCTAATAQSSDPPSVLLLKELSEDRSSDVRLLTSLFAPNTSSPWHVHPSAVAVYVEVGTGVWEIDGRLPKTVTAGQGLLEPANKRSRVTNILPTQILKLVSFQISDPARPFSIQSK